METTSKNKIDRRRNHRIAAGVILILFGISALLQQWFDVGNYFILVIGLGMLVWGSISRRTGWIIPGGVLTGIGLGILISEGPWHFPETEQNGIFLLCFALGWLLIAALTALFTCTQWWALIPGGIMTLIGSALLVMRGNVRWEDLNLVYAAILISVGVALLFSRSRTKKNGDQGQ